MISKESISEIIVVTISPMIVGMYFLFLKFLPILSTDKITSSVLFFYQILLAFLVLDITFSLIILFNTTDYEKHKYYRMNIGVLAVVIFSQLFLVLPAIQQLPVLDPFISRNWLVFVSYLLKLPVLAKIVKHYQKVSDAVTEFQ